MHSVINTTLASLNAPRILDAYHRKDVLQARPDRVQAEYLRQFIALDTTLAQLSATSRYLTQQLAKLPRCSDSWK